MAKKDEKKDEVIEEVIEEVVEEPPQEEPLKVALNRCYKDGDGKRYVWTMKSGATEPSMLYID